MRLWRYSYSRFRLKFGEALRKTSVALSVLCAVASLLCIVDLLLYFGFDHNPADKALLHRGLRVAQGVFAVGVVYGLVFDYKATSAEMDSGCGCAAVVAVMDLSPPGESVGGMA
jgi:hypothetical protein